MEQEPERAPRNLGDSRGQTGLILGRFSPPHAGHEFLIEVAGAYCEHLVIAVTEDVDDARTPLDVRQRWVSKMAPHAAVIAAPTQNLARVWRQRLPARAQGRVDLTFGERSQRIATLLGARYVPVERQARLAPRSREVEADPVGHWSALSATVKADLALRVALLGPESTGKSTLAKALADEYHTFHVGEYVRPYLDSLGRTDGTLQDIATLAKGQVVAEDALAGRANRILFCDTNLVSTVLWSEVLFGECPRQVVLEMERRHYALHLVTAVDVPYTADPQRCHPNLEDRVAFFERTVAILRKHGIEPVVLDGPLEARMSKARAAIKAISNPILR